MSEMKLCPFCGSESTSRESYIDRKTYYRCSNLICPSNGWFTFQEWQSRPLEVALKERNKLLLETAVLLQKRIDELEEYEQACFVARQKDEKLWVKALMALQEQPKLQKRIDELEAQLAQVAKENDWMKYPEPPESGAK